MEIDYLSTMLLTISASGVISPAAPVEKPFDIASIFKDNAGSIIYLNHTSSATKPVFDFAAYSPPKLDIPKSMKWLRENRYKYRGAWVVLVGDTLIGTGKSPTEFVNRAREMGFRSPFISFIEEETSASIDGWS